MHETSLTSMLLNIIFCFIIYLEFGEDLRMHNLIQGYNNSCPEVLKIAIGST